mmetsp:Transcript_35103/g.108755  ORF Transcript_35103/g.108755 Transcript_35103/m.108755 type:complete len:412 (+) Transcript_35103:192-1427(+)
MGRAPLALLLVGATLAHNTSVYDRPLPALRCDRGGAVDKSREVTAEPALFFVHVFKAAGSSVRGIFRTYAEKCAKRWACLVQCQRGGAPTPAGVLPCRLRDTVNLNRGAVVERNEGLKGKASMRRNPDGAGLGRHAHVVGGHFHYGLHAILPAGRPYAYVTVVREPVSTWISGMRYHDKKLDTVEKIRAAADAFMPKGSSKHYANGITYLGQVDALPTGRKTRPLEKLFAAVSHLEDVAVVGVVESWPTTVDLLEKVLDATGAVPALWDRYRAARRTKNKAKTDVNPRDVVAAFRADPDFWAAAQQFLRFENAFYVAAVARHALACRHVLGAACRLRREGGLANRLNLTLLAPELLSRHDVDAAARINSVGALIETAPELDVSAAHLAAKKQAWIAEKRRAKSTAAAGPEM